jgi:hypothetical protein
MFGSLFADDLVNAIARAVAGEEPVGTLNQQTTTFAIMEFLMDADSNAIKALWRKHGFADISPIWGGRSQVPTFKDQATVIRQWPDFQRQMTDVEADWYYVSGHHGPEFESDYDWWGEGAFWRYNHVDRVGFFNEIYHHGVWHDDSVDNPTAHASPLDVYMKTASDDWVYDLGPQDNPLFNAPHTQCKGVMLVGCNTLIYRHCRMLWRYYFPNAVVIGMMSKESNSIARILNTVQQYGREFFLDPKSISPVELARSLNPFLKTYDLIGVMSDGRLYTNYDGRDVEADVEDELSVDQFI